MKRRTSTRLGDCTGRQSMCNAPTLALLLLQSTPKTAGQSPPHLVDAKPVFALLAVPFSFVEFFHLLGSGRSFTEVRTCLQCSQNVRPRLAVGFCKQTVRPEGISGDLCISLARIFLELSTCGPPLKVRFICGRENRIETPGHCVDGT